MEISFIVNMIYFSLNKFESSLFSIGEDKTLGLDFCKGFYVCYLDSDVFIHKLTKKLYKSIKSMKGGLDSLKDCVST